MLLDVTGILLGIVVAAAGFVVVVVVTALVLRLIGVVMGDGDGEALEPGVDERAADAAAQDHAEPEAADTEGG